ncbi:MAG: hypothetical protein K8R68_01955 [Bacteroidales bacterium]|nr:hypothetical protein [Bacteroidales bacterium]
MQSHGDLDYNEEIILHTDGDSPQQTIEDILQITFEGGGDPHEKHIDGIENLLRIVPWAANPANTMSAMIVFLTSDTKSGQRLVKQDLSLISSVVGVKERLSKSKHPQA